MNAVVLMNAAAGTLAAAAGSPRDVVEKALAAAGLKAEIRAVPGPQLRDAALEAVKEGVDIVIASGGDGTISAVAGALCGTAVPLGVLPVGTLNHFARDLGIPLDPQAAAEVIKAGHLLRIDVGRVNDRVFVNNSSLGQYARAVRERERGRSRYGWSKWPAMAWGMLTVFRRFPMLDVEIQVGEEKLVRRTPLLFVGNNLYQLDLPNAGKRACLNQGELSLFIANTQSRWGMLKLIFRAFFNRLEQSRDFDSYSAPEVYIRSRRRRVHVALDGEVFRFHPPLHYQVWPGALQVFAPPAVEELPECAPGEQSVTTDSAVV